MKSWIGIWVVLVKSHLFGYLEYIQVIMSMEESVQHVVMMAIQEVSAALCY